MKIKHTAYSNKSHWGMGGPGAGGCLRRSLSGWKYFKKNVYGRDLRSSQNSKQSVWISIRKCLTHASRCRGKNYKGPISQLPRFPVELPRWFQSLERLASALCGMDPGEKWTKARRKERLSRRKGKFCGYILEQNSDPFLWPTWVPMQQI